MPDPLPDEPWITVLHGELIEVQSLDSGLQACGFRTRLTEPEHGNQLELQVPAIDAEAVHRFVTERWREAPSAASPAEQEQRQHVEALGLRIRHAAFWAPPIVFAPALRYLLLSGTLPERPAQHGMCLAACWFTVVATVGGAGAIVYAVAS